MSKTCKYGECNRRVYDAGYCTRHYRLWLDGELSDPEPVKPRPSYRVRQKMARESRPIPHGTPNGYGNYGCRCDACRAAHSKYMFDMQAAPCADCGMLHFGRYHKRRCRTCRWIFVKWRTAMTQMNAEHGTWAKYDYGCRCRECLGMANSARQSYRSRHPEEKLYERAAQRAKRWARKTPAQRKMAEAPAKLAQEEGLSLLVARAILDEMGAAYLDGKSRREIYALYLNLVGREAA